MQDGYFIVNFHEHPGDYAAEHNATMGIDMAVLLSVGTDAMAKAVAMARKKPDEFVPFYWVDNTRDLSDEPERLRRAVEEQGIRGVKFQPMDQHWFADDRRIYPIYEVCEELGLVCTWHAGIVKLGMKYELGVPMLARYVDPLPIDRVAFDFPDLKLCIAHMGGNYHYRALVECGGRVRHLHLHETFDLETRPDHRPPLHRDGIIAWADVFAGLRDIGYDGELIFEDGRGENPAEWSRAVGAFPEAFVRRYGE